MKKLLLILLCLPFIGFGQGYMFSSGLEAMLLGLVVGGIMFICDTKTNWGIVKK
ncbi:hypothetical protein N9B89_04230 [Flavobacteriales bacterium]|jgi:hypothetical protein|nr:hypothetical protein [Flavobacteriales bacterium]